jgi:hypothetical protein
MKRITILILALFSIATCIGCAKQSGFSAEDTETYTYQKAGYSLDIPKGWEKCLEDKNMVGFVSSEPAAALNIVFEIGGYDYYSLDNLAREVCFFLGKKIDSLKLETLENKYHNGWEACWFVVGGVLPGKQKVVIKGFIFEPDIGIRYYLLFTSEKNEYSRLEIIFDKIAGSFRMVKSQDELYQQLSEPGKEKAEAE